MDAASLLSSRRAPTLARSPVLVGAVCLLVLLVLLGVVAIVVGAGPALPEPPEVAPIRWRVLPLA
jgi:hypothetical protein